MCSADIFLGVLAVLFPPLPVWVKRGICSADSFISILLCVLGFIPGLIHAWYIIAKFPEPPSEYEALPQNREGDRATYVQTPHGPHCKQPKSQDSRSGMNYGSTQNASQQKQSHPAIRQPQEHGVAAHGEGSSNDSGVPPSYAEVVAGDHKVQSRD